MSESEIEIGTLPPEQWQAYKTLRLEALMDSPQAYGTSYAQSIIKPDSFWRERLEDAARGENVWLLFAKSQGELVGLIGAFVADDEPEVVAIVSVYVTSKARGQGIGKQLLAAILAEVTSKNKFKTARLTVNPMQIAALSLYRSSGFEVVAEEDTLMGDGNVYREFIMEKPLEPFAKT
ncbi:hypothetical protein IAD21_01380 [Abditibacteriota bacterium]|nr:hypothetical protein IAD21_01380 [Abditibacteriota bacterium]